MTFEQVLTEAGRSAISPLASTEHALKTMMQQTMHPAGLTDSRGGGVAPCGTRAQQCRDCRAACHQPVNR